MSVIVKLDGGEVIAEFGSLVPFTIMFIKEGCHLVVSP